jgi:hypothetical protein
MKLYLKSILLVCAVFVVHNTSAQEKKITLTNNFDKIIVSPHIEAVFIQGATPAIEIQSITVETEKLKYEIVNNTLQVYLEGAKTVTDNKKIENNGWKQKIPIYKNTVAKVTIIYASADSFSLRGEEKMTFESPLNQEKCTLRIYGESEVLIKEAKLDNLRVAIYGESNLIIESGDIAKQRITAYGSSKMRSLGVTSKEAKITAYGEGTYQFNVSEKLKVTSYGEANILYKGNPDLKKGIVIGESTIRRLSK